MALQLPSGKRLGASPTAVVPTFNDAAGLTSLATGHIGALAEAIFEGRVRLDASMRDLMAVAAALLQGRPLESSNTRWRARTLQRARSLAAHSPERDARQIQFHYDVSDAFYALWLDPLRVYSCAYFRDSSMTFAQA